MGPVYLFLALFLMACGGKEEKTSPQIKDLTQAVYASGKIYPLQYHRIVSGMPGYLEMLYVQVGDTVKVGSPLFKVRNEVNKFSINIAKNNLKLAKRMASDDSELLVALKKEMEAQGKKLQLDSVTYIRTKALVEQNAGTRQALDQAQTNFSTSRDLYFRAKANYEANKLRLVNDVANAENQLKAQEAQADEFIVYATFTGRVYDIIAKQGEYVSPQVPVLEMGSMDQFEVELAIDETDLRFIAQGQSIVYSSESFGKEVFNGVLEKIYPKISPINKSIKAIGTIELKNKEVFAGNTIEANIIFKQRKQVMVLPRVYVFNDSVMLADGKRKVPVVTGAMDVEFVEIVSGIQPTDVVLKP